MVVDILANLPYTEIEKGVKRMTAFGNFLYELRKEKGMTQQELAEKLNITNKAVSKWETGEAFPETAQLVPLADIFGVTVDELLRGKRSAEKSAGEGSIDSAVPASEQAASAAQTVRAKRRLSKQARFFLCAAAAIIVVLLCVLIPIVSCANNIFRAGKVEKIAFGDDISRVYEILGEPDDENGSYFEYYDQNYEKLRKELQEWMEGKSDPAAALESFKQISKREFGYIRVTFSSEQVTSVLLDTAVTAAGAGEKRLREVSLVDWSLVSANIVYRAYYTDGSYFLGGAEGTFSSKIDGESVTVFASWTDEFGNACSVPLDKA